MLGCFGLPVPLVVLGGAALITAQRGDEQPGLDERAARPGLCLARSASRVTSIDLLGSYALLPVGYGLTGWATDQWGAPTVFLLGGGLTALVCVLGLLHPRVRGVD